MRLLFTLLFFLSTVCLFGAPEKLVTVSVKGTNIDRLPKAIDILVSDPEESATTMLDQGGRLNPGIENSVYFQKIYYIFQTPEEWKLQDGTRLKVGDVIYTFFVDSEEAKTEFVKEYGLEPLGKMVERDGHAPILYHARSRYHVLVLFPQSHFTCSMHPQLSKAEEGECPTCGMALIETQVYR